jgi:hypothetical protein
VRVVVLAALPKIFPLDERKPLRFRGAFHFFNRG